jgi:hypothetical protein
MKDFIAHTFDFTRCKKELSEFKTLLDAKNELSEKNDILPFFKKRYHLSAFIGSYFSGIDEFDRVAYEYSIFGDFSSDLAIGDSNTNTYCFVEFEDATPTSIFKKNPNKATLEWSPRFEHGFSQIVDWFWKLDDMKNTTTFQNQFGVGHIRYYGLLVLGRRADLSHREQTRLRWRLEKVLVDSKPVVCVTFDELFDDLNHRLRNYKRYSAVP